MPKNEAKIRFTAETSDFNDSINKADNEIRQFRAELKLNETQMQATGTNVEALESKHKILTEQLKASEDKTEALRQKLSKAAEIFGENSESAMRLKTKLLDAQTAEEKLRQAVSNCETELEQQRAAESQTETATEKLTGTIERQQTELNQLKRDYMDAVIQYGKTSDEAKDLEKSIGDLSGELQKNKTELSNASDKADALDRSLGNADGASKNADGGFTILKGTIADLASNAIQGAISKIGEFISYLGELPGATLDLRQDLSTLTTSFDTMGFSTSTAKDTWKDLYAVFGEDDRAVETANNISKMAGNQKELNDWVTITTGVWGTYQDSLPVEGLAEASNETAKTGKVTGVLADALNWSSEAAAMFSGYMSDDVITAEDAFNVALSECSTEAERQSLITETLTALYGDAAETYRDTAGAQMDAKEATADNKIAEAELAEAIEPVTTEFTNLKTELLTSLMPAVEKVSGVMLSALDWAKEHPVAMKALAAVVGVLAVGLGALAIAMGVYATAQLAAAIGATSFALPFLAIVAAIAAVVAIIVVVVSYWDELKQAVSNCVSSISEAWSSFVSWIDTNIVQPIKDFFTGLWDGITSTASGLWEGVKTSFSDFVTWIDTNIIQPIKNFFSGLWDGITGAASGLWEGVKTSFAEFVTWIDTNIIQPVTNLFSTLWSGVQAVWDGIGNTVSTAMDSIKSVITGVWDGIKFFIDTTVTGIKTIVSTVWNGIKSVTSNVFGSIKSTVSSIWNGIKSTVSTVVNGVKSTVTGVWDKIKSTTTNVWNGIKDAILNPIESAKDKISEIIDKIKGFFSGLKISWPNIKMPHFSISPSGWKISDLLKGSIPHLSIDWYRDGGIMMKPTIFGANGSRLMAGGEAGPEAILPIDRLEGYISGAIERSANGVSIEGLVDAIERLADRAIELKINDRTIATATASASDNVNGLRSTFKNRGLALD